MSAPQVIGRYEIIEELGRGAMGSVFKARDPVVGRTVALKTIHSAALSGSQSDEYRARFYREARASGVLAHPGIVPVFDVGEHEGAPFLVMEFVDGRTLADAVKKGERLTLDRVCEIGQQLAEALGYAHRQGVIHRDIKPANILLTSRAVYGSERPRITDFGIAKLAASEITTTGQLLGTPSFMPPEQFTGAPIDGRADLFSLGVILYSLATGEQPFPGETMTAVSYKVVHTDPVPPAKLNPAVPARLESVILKCLAKNPAERYQTGEEIAQDLAAIRTSAVATAQQPIIPAPAAEAADDTLGPTSVYTSIPPAPAMATVQKPATAAPPTSAQPANNHAKPVPFETIFAVILLSVAALGVAVAGEWFFLQRHHKPAAPPQEQAATIPAPEPVAVSKPAIPAAQPGPAPPAATPESPAPAATPEPTPPAAATPQPPLAKPDESKSPAKAPAKAKSSTVKTPPAKPEPPAPAPAATNPSVAKSVPPPPPPTASAPATHSTVAVFDPRKADPNTNAKLKIELTHLPDGVPYTVEMNSKVYLRGITGESEDLSNLFVPPGVQQFQVTVKSGGQQKVSNIVSDDFKAKKRKTLKIDLLDQATTPSKSAEPISSAAKIFLSLK